MSRLGSTREWLPINPLEALLHPKVTNRGGPRVTIIAAHLCDIVAATGGHLGRWNAVAIVHTTLSQVCSEAARELADVAPNVFCSLGYRRQETPAHMVHLTADVAAVLKQARPDIVLTQAYEGGDCDRDAVAFAVHHAVRPLKKPPVIVEMTGWNAATGLRSLGEFLPQPGVSERGSRLTAEERARKAAMLAAFPDLRDRVPALDLHVERFRMAPRYDFTQPPHPGPLFYEQAGGRWTGQSWRSQALEALPQLAAGTCEGAKV